MLKFKSKNVHYITDSEWKELYDEIDSNHSVDSYRSLEDFRYYVRDIVGGAVQMCPGCGKKHTFDYNICDCGWEMDDNMKYFNLYSPLNNAWVPMYRIKHRNKRLNNT